MYIFLEVEVDMGNPIYTESSEINELYLCLIWFRAQDNALTCSVQSEKYQCFHQ